MRELIYEYWTVLPDWAVWAATIGLYLLFVVTVGMFLSAINERYPYDPEHDQLTTDPEERHR